jgi:hypothetical protein
VYAPHVRFRRFSVVGYKNLEQPILLDELGPINVIHGANNVGKSNLLQAIELFFRCLRLTNGGVPFGQNTLTPDLLGVSTLRQLFHLERPSPIILSAVLDLRPEELSAAGMSTLSAITELDIEIQLDWSPPQEARCSIKRFRYADNRDAARAPGEYKDASAHATFLARNPLVSAGPSARFALVGVRRSLEEDPIQRDEGDAPLAREMYDCRESLDRARRDRWRSFVRAMGELRDITGEGTFEVTYPRNVADGGARLVFDTDTMRIPFGLLGSGVQQVAALLGHVLVRNASIVGIEEPELNLRWDLQDRLREALKKLVSDPPGTGGVDQLFITSHSPAFESGESFWLMEAGPKGPHISRRPASELRAVLGFGPRHLGLPEHAPQAYVTTQGVVRLPDHVLARLRLARGGGVIFLESGQRGVRILSDEDYLDELGLTDDVEPGDGSD